MPELIRFVLRNAALGIAVGWIMVGAMLAFDFAGMGTLIFNSGVAYIAIPMLLAGFGITFGSAQVGFAVMALGRSEPPGGRREKKARIDLPVLLPARAQRPSRR
jgi:hypothetical protein